MADEKDTEWQQARREAVAILQCVLCWDLQPTRWEQVREVLIQLAAAVWAPTPDALRDATETLGFYTPVRIETRLGESTESVPGVVREQIAELVDALQPRDARGENSAGAPSRPGQAGRRGA